MDINYFFIISLVFAILFIISKKFDFFNDDISYSNHKIIGAENRSPLVIGGIFFVIVFLYFNPYSSINFNILLPKKDKDNPPTKVMKIIEIKISTPGMLNGK